MSSQVRSLSVLEGIALASDPNYKVLGATYPWIARRLLTDRSPELKVPTPPCYWLLAAVGLGMAADNNAMPRAPEFRCPACNPTISLS